MRLLIVRHGQTNWNLEKKLQGRTDTKLNETGIEQAKIAREKLANYDIDVIISSPLKRARKTAEIITSGRDIPIVTDEDIIERAFGIYEGMKIQELDLSDISKKEEDGVESTDKILERIKKFLEKIKKQYQNKTVLIVSHKGTIMPMCCYLDGLSINSENMDKYKIENCSILEYEI